MGPEAIGSGTITLKVTYKILVGGVWDGSSITSASDSVTVNVNRPHGDIAIKRFGMAGIGGNFLGLDKDSNINGHTTVGIEWDAKLSAADLNSGIVKPGTIGIVQTAQTKSDRLYTTSNGVGRKNSFLLKDKRPGVFLDTLETSKTFLYGDVTSPEWGDVNSMDSPAQPLTVKIGTLDSVTMRDDFTSTLMYQPTGGIWVPVGDIQWSWGGSAVSAGGGKFDPVGCFQKPTP